MGDQQEVASERRIARLEEELVACRAEAETQLINYEQSSRAMEERFTALSEEHGKLAAAKEQLQTDNRRMIADLTEVRGQVHNLQAQLVKKDAALEEKSVRIEALHSEKRALDKHLQHRQEEIAEAEHRFRKAQENIVSLTSQITKLDADFHEAKASQRRTDLEKLQLQQINENLQRNNKWLEENMSHLSEALKEERSKAASQIMELEGKLQQSEMAVASLERSEGHLKARLEQKEKIAEEAQNQLKADREDFANKEQQFETELAAHQKLAALYKSNSEKRSAEAAELESVVRDLRKHVQDMTEAHREAVQKLEEAVADAEERFNNEKTKCQRMLEAAATGHLPSTPTTPSATISRSSGDGLPSPNAIASMSKTEIYTKYVEAATGWKDERLKNRQNEILLESLCMEMEKKAILVREQQAEHERVQAAYGQMSAALEAANHQHRHSHAVQLDLEAQIRRDARKHSLLEQQIQDLGRQVSVLLNEQQRLTGESAPSGLQLALPSSNGSAGRITADDVISQNLVNFTSIQELQEVNRKQLAVIRELSAAQEDNASELRAELEAEKAAIRKKNETNLEHYRQQRIQQEELVQQIARQRDMFRKLLQDAANNPGRAAAAAADLQLIAAADSQTANGSSIQAPEEPNYKQLYADLESELARVREEATEHARMLREESSKAKEDAASARAQAARALADATFERQRAERQTEFLEEQRQQMQQISEHSSKYQEMMISLQQRLSSALADLQAAQNHVSVLENKVHSLEVEQRLAANTEQRLSADVSRLSSEKHTREAELKAERANLEKLEQQFGAERARLTADLAKAQQAETEAVRELGEAQKRARDATAAKDVIQERADDRAARLEEDVKKALAAESEALQKAATAHGKAEVLQKALQKAEERAATLEFQVNSRSQQAGEASTAAGPSTAADREAQLSSQLKLLQEELNTAYEKAAQATSHVSQYQALAESSDQALKAMQIDHDAYKAEADKHIAAAAKEATELQEQLAAAKKEATDLQGKVRDLETDLQQAKEATEKLETKLKADLEQKTEILHSKLYLIGRLEKDIEFWRQKFNSAEERAQREVLDHAATIKQLQAADTAKTILDNTINERIHDKAVAETKQAAAENELRVKTAELHAAVEAANRRRELVEQQNKLLHEQLERMSQQLPSGGESELAGVVSYLRHQTEVLEEEKQLIRHEADRLRSEITTQKRTIDSLRAQQTSEEQRQQRSQRDEALFEERRQHQADLNMVKESNASLRSQNTELDKQVRMLRVRLQDAEKERRPRELELTRLKADVENLDEEIKLVREESTRWEKRVSQLQEKYGKVDLEEYRQVEAQLKELQQTTKDLVPRADLAKAESRIKEVETIARGKVGSDFHQRTVQQLHQQLAAAQRAGGESQAKGAEERSRLAAEVEALKSQLAALETARQQADDKALRFERSLKRHIATYNPEKKKLDEWRAERDTNIVRAQRAAQLEAVIQELLPSSTSADDLKSRLLADKAKILELEAQIEIAARNAPDVAALRSSLADAQNRLSQCQKHGAELEFQLERCRREEAQSARQLAAAEATIKQLEATMKELRSSCQQPETLSTVALSAVEGTTRVAEQPVIVEATAVTAAPDEPDAASAELLNDADGMEATEEGEQEAAVPPEQESVELISFLPDRVTVVSRPEAESAALEAITDSHSPPALPEPQAEPINMPSLEQIPEAVIALPASLPVFEAPAVQELQAAPAPQSAVLPALAAPTPAPVVIEPLPQPQSEPEAAATEKADLETAPLSAQAPTEETQPAATDSLTEAALPVAAASKPPQQEAAPPADLPKSLEAPAATTKAADTLATSGGKLNPDAEPFQTGAPMDIMAALRQQALDRQRQKEAQPTSPTKQPVATVERTPAQVAGEAAAKRARGSDLGEVSVYVPPAKRLRNVTDADTQAAPKVQAEVSPELAAAEGSQSVPATQPQAGDAEGIAVEEDAAKATLEEEDFGDDARWQMGEGDQEEGGDIEEDVGDEDMPEMPHVSSPTAHAPVDPTLPSSVQQSERETSQEPQKPAGEVQEQTQAAEGGQEKPSGQDGEEGMSEKPSSRRRRSQGPTPIIWGRSSGARKEKEEEGPSAQPQEGTGSALPPARGRGRGRGRRGGRL